MTVPIKIELDNLDTALLGFSHAQPQLKKATAPVLGQIARTIRSRARSNVNISHPRNFFVARGSHGSRLSPSYRTKQEGEFWWVVQTHRETQAAGKLRRSSLRKGHPHKAERWYLRSLLLTAVQVVLVAVESYTRHATK